MLPTKTYSSLKGMLPKIHHPLPLNEKSTKKLLDTLTTSFRKHLDREHGWLDEEAEAAKTGGDKSATAQSTRQASLGASPVHTAATTSSSTPSKTQTTSPHTDHNHNHSRPTDRHLRAILSNPLFSYDQTVNKTARRNSTGAIKSAAAAAVAAASSSISTPNAETTAPTATLAAERDPLEIFDWAVARGLMTTKRAAGCLLAKRREAIQSSHVSAKSFMAASGAGFKVLQWLRAAGLEHDLSFLNDAQLTGVLVEFLAAEPALEAVVWQWIERLQRGEGPQQLASKTAPAITSSTGASSTQGAAPQPVSTASFLLDKLVEAKAHGGATLDDAYLAMRRGADMFSKAAGSDAQAFDRNVFWPWCGLSWMTTIKTWHLANPTPRLYESFVSIMDHDERPSIRLERAHLDLRHPTRPTPAPAQALLADDHLLQHVRASMPRVERPPGRQLKYPGRIVSMGLDTVRHLAFVGEPDEAQRVLERLRLQFRVDQEILDTR
ncbi:hypothetical protein SBRCBS47491_003988 [Sporothrix bragantina]|uniref:Uncharacterized protein n=1 Tax=Sporothrix bragantina TaxID=671064 RepID=A0ABP0BL92_9PEZI